MGMDMCGIYNVLLCVCVDFLMCFCAYVFISNVCVCVDFVMWWGVYV